MVKAVIGKAESDRGIEG
ncbi:Protein of unknown function [Lactobacillus helveticus CIRM-BIA 101]|uniref:Uncharacterized protein n=2 Tax=Lactobacillus helveticus TaxID=1587 RepID=U6FE15_LACHE|nr:Protein of unknown function [Lactobacillus helveticus CIRM-BIA 951]CDI61549.1 Protein of unknown function [Lactobacillus helveticus CIRM-BIA 104]CDI63762.1 Protein of unknown function [Lactobacillus helveticus CIRM-BIA 103]CDI65176.1 Protein of unknown function [Lactobacillus helveticus CIRM-BIA 101]